MYSDGESADERPLQVQIILYFNAFAGTQKEEDLYVRLIDSSTKQVEFLFAKLKVKIIVVLFLTIAFLKIVFNLKALSRVNVHIS